MYWFSDFKIQFTFNEHELRLSEEIKHIIMSSNSEKGKEVV